MMWTANVFRLLSILTACLVHGEEDQLVQVPDVPPMFQAEMQITMLSDNSTYHGQVYFNSTSYEGAVVLDMPSRRMHIIYNFDADQNQTLLVIGNTCLDVKGQNLFIFSPDENFYPGYLIGLAKGMNHSEEEVEVLGIQADLFLSEHLVFRAINATDVLFESYWSHKQSNWNFPNCPNSDCVKWRVPLKTVVSAEINGEIENIVYVYYNYRETNLDLEAFQLPVGISCLGVQSRKLLPDLEYDFSVGSETASSDLAKTFVYYTLHYSSRMKVTRRSGYFGADELTHLPSKQNEIVDYQRGVRYRINGATQTCEQTEKLSSSEQNENLHHVYDFLTFDTLNIDNAFYVGKRNILDTECDVWVISNFETQDTKTITRIYLSSVEKKLPDGKMMVKWVPIFINQTETDMMGIVTQITTRAYYNFEDELPNWNTFDITTCFAEANKLRLQIELEGEHDPVKENPAGFVEAFRAAIIDVASISPIRLQSIMLDYVMNGGEPYLIFTITLLEDIQNIGVSFYVDNDEDPPSNNDAYALIEDAVFNGKFDVNYEMQVGSPPLLYRGTSIRKNKLPTNPDDDLETLLDVFSPKGAKDLKGSGFDYQLADASLYDCGVQCMQSEAEVCESFAFCKDTLSCKISRLHFENITDDQKADNSACSLYTRSYILDYEESQFRKVKANEQYDEQYVQAEILSPEECARKCSLDPDKALPFHCEGFNICLPDGSTSICEWRSRHILGIPPDTDVVKDKNCTYFSRDYYDDYLVHTNQELTGVALEVSKLTTAKDCARLCTTLANSGRKYESFQMCKNTEDTQKSKCYLLAYDKANAKIKLKSNRECDFYSRRTFPKHFIVQPTNPPTTKKPKTGYSIEAMIGLGLGMVALGFILGAIVMLLIMRFQVRGMQS